jgi:hypothetical protein
VRVSDSAKAQPATQPTPEFGTGEFIEFLDGLHGDELHLLTRFVLIEKSQTLNCGPSDSAVASLVSKKFLTRVPKAQSLQGMRDREPVPYTMQTAAWRHLSDNPRWLLNRAKERNTARPERLKAYGFITFDDSYA